MNVTKKMFAASLFMAAFSVSAATPQIDFNVEATIPDNDFYVNAVNGWNANVQKMSWNEAQGSLNAITQQLQMKNSTGGIKAYLSSQPALTSANSVDVINLKVKIAGKDLPLNAASAVSLFDATEAKTEKTASMEVSSVAGSRPVSGLYTGAVTMIFDNDTTTP